MLLWVSVAGMSALAIAGVLWPLFRRSGAAREGGELAVYHDQLQEIERDRQLGLLAPAEAGAARVEISRRLLAASQPGESTTAPSPFPRNAIVAASLVLLTAGTSALYLRVGTPSLASEPQQIAARDASVDRLVAQAEDYLARNPNDARGWEVLAPVYMRVGRPGDSALAWRNVIQLGGPDADRLANLGEALTAQANGVVTEEAKDAFVRSVALDSTVVTSRFYLAIAAEQDGKRSEAARIFKELIDQAPANAAWAADVKAGLARVDGKPDGAPAVPKQAAAASQVGPQDDAIQGMVDRLARRLQQDGSDPDGWVRLVRSYVVLKDETKKAAAIADARNALAGDAEKLAKFEAGLKTVERGEEPPGPAAAATPLSAASGEHDQTALITRLAERLQRAGSDPEGWLMLSRSYATLNELEKTQAAIRDARAALAGDAEKLGWFNQSLKRFKLE